MPVWGWFVLGTAAFLLFVIVGSYLVARKNRRESEAMLAENKAAADKVGGAVDGLEGALTKKPKPDLYADGRTNRIAWEGEGSTLLGMTWRPTMHARTPCIYEAHHVRYVKDANDPGSLTIVLRERVSRLTYVLAPEHHCTEPWVELCHEIGLPAFSVRTGTNDDPLTPMMREAERLACAYADAVVVIGADFSDDAEEDEEYDPHGRVQACIDAAAVRGARIIGVSDDIESDEVRARLTRLAVKLEGRN